MPKDIHVPARIEGGKIPVKANLGQTVIVTEGADEYTGQTVVTPSESAQTLQTADKLVKSDVTVNPIPSEYIIPTGTEEISVVENGIITRDISAKALLNLAVNVPMPGYKVVTGSFAGNGALSVSIPCDFDPDIIYICAPNRLDDYTVESGGVTWAMLVTDLVCFTIRKTPTATGTSGFRMPVTNNRPGKVYDNGTLTVYLPGSSIHKLADGETYNYVLVKLP